MLRFARTVIAARLLQSQIALFLLGRGAPSNIGASAAGAELKLK
jgi:hypothetical protein